MDQRGNGDFIALHEEARNGEAQNQVLAYDGLEGSGPQFGVLGNTAGGGAPGSQRIGEIHLGMRVAGAVGGHIGGPESGIGESFADLGLHQSLGFELRQPRGRTQFRQLHAALAGLAVEVVVQRILAHHAVPFVGEEVGQRVLQRVGTDGVDSFIHHSQAELGQRHRLAIHGGRADTVLRRLAGLILRFVGGDGDIHLVVNGRHLDVLGAAVEIAAADELGGNEDARLLGSGDGDFEKRGGILRADQLVVEQVAAFHGDVDRRVRLADHKEHLRGVARMVGLLVEDDL